MSNYKTETPASMRTMTVEQAIAERQAIQSRVGDLGAFRRRGETYELDAEEIVIYDDLKVLDYPLGERGIADDHQPNLSKRQQKFQTSLLKKLQRSISDIETAQSDLTVAMRQRDDTIAQLLAKGVDHSVIQEFTKMPGISLAMVDTVNNSPGAMR